MVKETIDKIDEPVQLQRHDMVLLNVEGAAIIAKELLNHHDVDVHKVLLSEWYQLLLNGSIPGIVRRDSDFDRVRKGEVPVGISLPLRVNGQRMRYASWVNRKDILRIIRPSQLPLLPFFASTKSLTVLKELIENWPLAIQKLGVWGANALEIITSLSYTDNNSDLDIIVYSENYTELKEIEILIESLEDKFSCRIDVELMLSNHYGVSLKEFFQDSTYILGKSLTEVALLKKSDLSIE